MMKATLRGAVLLGLLAFNLPAFAEVQNVKVGGEVNVRSFLRKSLRGSEDVLNGVGATVVPVGTAGSTTDFGSGEDDFLQQLTAVDIGADLTENVSTQLRLINQRVWGSVAADATDATDADANHVEISLANLTLKELFYSPLTVTVGRQRLWFGRGFIVGSRLLHGDNDPSGSLAADEFSDHTAFDAIRGTLDLSEVVGGTPLTVDAVYAKVDENDVSCNDVDACGTADDVNLVGVNVGTRFDQMNGEMEAYYWNKRNNELAVAPSNTLDTNPQANTIGFRGSASPMEGTTAWFETAYQWGRRVITSAASNDAEGAAGDDYQAWAANLGLDYTASDAPWSPTIGGEWIFYSGDEGDVTAIAGWDPVYRGAFTTAIREFQAAPFYMPAQSGAATGTGGQGTFNLITASTTNQHQLALHGTVRPIEDLTVDNRLTWFIADNGIVPVDGAKRESFFGTEWDMQANYAYTDDVNFGLIYALFNPGGVFRTPYDDTAQELVTSVSVKF